MLQGRPDYWNRWTLKHRWQYALAHQDEAVDETQTFFDYFRVYRQLDEWGAALSMNEKLINKEIAETQFLGPHLREHSLDQRLVLDFAKGLWERRWDPEFDAVQDTERSQIEPDWMLELAYRYGDAAIQTEARTMQLEVAAIRGLEQDESPVPGWFLEGPFDRVDEVNRLLDLGDHDSALALALQVSTERPSSESYGVLGDVYWMMGYGALAQESYEWASQSELIPGTWTNRWVLSRQDDGAVNTESDGLARLEHSVQGIAPLPAVMLELARAYRSAGRLEEARQMVREAMDSVTALPMEIGAQEWSSMNDELRLLKDELDIQRLKKPKSPLETQWVSTHRDLKVAMALAQKGLHDPAQKAYSRALRRSPQPKHLDAIRGALAWYSGDQTAAMDAWRVSLEWDPSQRSLWLVLGQLHQQRGEWNAARNALEKAGVHGVSEAWVWLAMLEASQNNTAEAQSYLNRFREGPVGRSLLLSRVRDLEIAMTPATPPAAPAPASSPWLAWAIVGGFASLIVVAWVTSVRRRRVIQSLLDEFPECSHDLARILSAIRHEILKHNTTLLDEVADAIEHGDHHAASFADIRLFGKPGSRDAGIAQRFEGYLNALERVGRRYRRRLDLRTRDPIVSPICQAIRELQDLEPALRRPWRSGAKVPEQLRRLSTVLNQTAYRALGELLQTMGTVQMEADFIREVAHRVQSEPALSNRGIPDIEIQFPEHSVPLRIFHGDLQDILANLIRNALEAGVQSGQMKVAVRVEEEDDPITGIENVAIRVLDQAPGHMKTSDLRGRNIGRGLGLSADLVARHEGSLVVEYRPDEQQSGWHKAIVLRLSRVENEWSRELPRSVRVEETSE